MQNVHGCQETNELEKLYYKAQKDNGEGHWGNTEGTVSKSTEVTNKKEKKEN